MLQNLRTSTTLRRLRWRASGVVWEVPFITFQVPKMEESPPIISCMESLCKGKPTPQNSLTSSRTCIFGTWNVWWFFVEGDVDTLTPQGFKWLKWNSHQENQEISSSEPSDLVTALSGRIFLFVHTSNYGYMLMHKISQRKLFPLTKKRLPASGPP